MSLLLNKQAGMTASWTWTAQLRGIVSSLESYSSWVNKHKLKCNPPSPSPLPQIHPPLPQTSNTRGAVKLLSVSLAGSQSTDLCEVCMAVPMYLIQHNFRNICCSVIYERFSTIPKPIQDHGNELKMDLEMLTEHEGKDMNDRQKITWLKENRHAFGRTALIFSGGGALGPFHMVTILSWTQSKTSDELPAMLALLKWSFKTPHNIAWQSLCKTISWVLDGPQLNENAADTSFIFAIASTELNSFLVHTSQHQWYSQCFLQFKAYLPKISQYQLALANWNVRPHCVISACWDPWTLLATGLWLKKKLIFHAQNSSPHQGRKLGKACDF